MTTIKKQKENEEKKMKTKTIMEALFNGRNKLAGLSLSIGLLLLIFMSSFAGLFLIIIAFIICDKRLFEALDTDIDATGE